MNVVEFIQEHVGADNAVPPQEEGESDACYHFRLTGSANMLKPLDIEPLVLPVPDTIVTPLARNERNILAELDRNDTYDYGRAIVYVNLWQEITAQYNAYTSKVAAETHPKVIVDGATTLYKKEDVFRYLFPSWEGQEPTLQGLTESNLADYVQYLSDSKMGFLEAIGFAEQD